MNNVLVNQETFNLKSTITDDWGGSHRIAIDLEALRDTNNWQIGIDLPTDYRIDQIYGAKLTQEDGKIYLSGQGADQSMVQGNKTEIILIIDEGNSGISSPVETQFIFANSSENYVQSSSVLDYNSQITEDWDGGYKLELDLTAESAAQDWQLDFSLPYNIQAAYGVDLINQGNGNYTISGQNDQVDLQSGQSIKPIFIIEDYGQQALNFNVTGSSALTKAITNKLTAQSSIVEDWDGGYKLELDLTAESAAQDWQLDFSLPYNIQAAYGVDLVNRGNGNYTISGQNDQVDLQSGQSIKPIFIIEDNGQQALELNITDDNYSVSGTPVTTTVEADSKISATPLITENWDGGYKLELELKAESSANNWQVDFSLPYQITEVYGVDLIDHGNGNYSISGQNDQVNLQSGESIRSILIIDDYGQNALHPQFDDSVEVIIPEVVNIPDSERQLVGQRGQFSYGEALQKNFLFFEANRSGPLPADNRIEWRSDATTNDGSDVGRDLNGGYFDAGDHIKFIQPMAFSTTMLAWGGADYKQAYAQSGQLDELLEAVKWSTDWFLKAHEMDGAGKTERLWVQVGDGSDHHHWVPAEEIANRTARPSFSIDRNRPGSDAAAGTASALAAAAVLFRGTDDAYADELVRNAEALYEFAETYRGKYSDSVPQASPFYTSWSGYGDELALGGAWLYRATGNSQYLTKAENHFKNNVGNLGDWSYATDDHSYAAATLLAKESSDPFFKGQAKGWLDTWVSGGGSVNYTSGGFAHRANWASVPLTLSAAFSAEWYNDHVEANSGYSDFANNQVDYVLGDNPTNFSYVVGFGDNYAQRTHHRSSAGSAALDGSDQINDHILYGAVVGGPGEPNDFSHNDRRNDWITNEVGTSYNAPFAGAAIQQYDNLGGDPLSEFELDQLIGIDANGVGF